MLLYSSNFAAQILGNIKDKAKSSSTSRATDFNRSRSNKNSINKTNENIEGESGEGSSEDIIDQDTNTLNFEGNQVYEFNSILKYEVSNFQDALEYQKTELNFYISDSVFVMDSGEGILIYDYKINKSFVLDKQNKTGVITALIMPDIYNLSQNVDLWDSMYEKTGKEKVISNHSCAEYTLKDVQEQKLSLWSSKENVLKDCSELTKKNIELFLMNLGVVNINSENFTIGLEMINADNVIETTIYFKSYDKQSSNLDLKEYQITSY